MRILCFVHGLHCVFRRQAPRIAIYPVPWCFQILQQNIFYQHQESISDSQGYVAYLTFCRTMGCTPVPATTDILCKYAAMLARSLKYNSVKQYLNIIHILHLEWDLPNPLLDNFRLRCVMQGIRRDVSDFVCRKLPMTPCLLCQVLSQLDQTCYLSHLLPFVTPAVISARVISRFTPGESVWGLIGVKLFNSNNVF